MLRSILKKTLPIGASNLHRQQLAVPSTSQRMNSSFKNDQISAPKLTPLLLALKQIENDYGKGSIMQLGKSQTFSEVDVISTGSLGLDHALGIGGLPKGRIVEIYGPEASGKTTIALHVIAECQRSGGKAVFVDAEHALDPTYSSNLGVQMDQLYLSQPDHGEQALSIVDVLVKSGEIDVVVVDSVAALVPKAELEGEMGDHHVALQARLMSQALRKLAASLSKTNTCIIFINQIRSKVGVVFGSPDVTAGGNALKFYCSVRMDVRKGQQIKKNGEPIGNLCKVKIAKNKLAPPFQLAEFDMMYGTGIDRAGELVDLGVQVGALKKNGTWYSINHESLGVIGSMIGQGKEKAKAFLTQNSSLSNSVESLIRSKLNGKSDDDESVEVDNLTNL